MQFIGRLFGLSPDGGKWTSRILPGRDSPDLARISRHIEPSEWMASPLLGSRISRSCRYFLLQPDIGEPERQEVLDADRYEIPN